MDFIAKQGFSAPEGIYLKRAFLAVCGCLLLFWGLLPLVFPPMPVLLRAILPQMIPLLLVGTVVFFSSRDMDWEIRFGLKWSGPFPWKFVFSFFLFLYVLTILLTAAVKQFADFFSLVLPPQPVVEYIMMQAGTGERIIILFLAVIVAPVTEEFLFRHIFYSRLVRQIHAGAAACITAFLFAVLHGSLLHGPSLFFMGLILQSAYCRTGTVLVPMAIHALFNATSVFLILTIQLQ